VFTGLIREVGRIERISSRASIARVGVAAPRSVPMLALGDSLSVNGICLTVVRLTGRCVEVEATDETRRVTTLARWAAGDEVHLEPSLRTGDPIGGHFVLGHVDGVGRVAALERRGGAATLRVALPSALAAQLAPKGSIAVDGVSLTLDEGPFPGAFSTTLIPHTLSVTRLGDLRPGDEVNLELDILAKVARSPVEPRQPITLASLLARGWQAPAR
jgi:riboflavin synthase alpha subunit